LTDRYGRRISYLRISVTDRCNLRCIYCMPPEGIALVQREEILSFEEIAEIARAGAELGLIQVRLTGGEPLVRRDLPRLVRMLRAIPQITDLSLTTNGQLLAESVEALEAAGLDRVNISLDTLDPDCYRALTGGGELERVLAGMEAALNAGFHPVKLNVVIIPEEAGSIRECQPSGTTHLTDKVRERDLCRFTELTRERPIHVRFIELMPIGVARTTYQSHQEIKQRLEKYGDLLPTEGPRGSGSAHYYRFAGAPGTIGFISPISERFCAHCNRLRLSARGELRSCLYSRGGTDLRAILREGGATGELKRAIQATVSEKPEARPDPFVPSTMKMSQIGG